MGHHSLQSRCSDKYLQFIKGFVKESALHQLQPVIKLLSKGFVKESALYQLQPVIKLSLTELQATSQGICEGKCFKPADATNQAFLKGYAKEASHLKIKARSCEARRHGSYEGGDPGEFISFGDQSTVSTTFEDWKSLV